MSFSVRRLNDRQRRSSVSAKAFFARILSVGQPVLRWWMRHLERKEEEKIEAHRMHLIKKILVILAALALSFVLLMGVARGLVALKILSFRSIINVTGGTLPTDAYGHTNILLLGSGDASHEGVDLTDSIMIAGIDATKTKSVALFSLPRDLYFLSTEKMGKGRINSLYRDYKYYLINRGAAKEEASREALRELAKEIGKALGIEIHETIKVDFIAFVQFIDALGGVDVVVPEDLTDPEYPGPNYTYQTFSIAAGPQHLDGETALKYARSRHSTSDFDRSARQQQLIKAIGDTVRSAGLLSRPNRLLSLLTIVQQHVEMSLDAGGVLSLAKAGLSVDTRNIISMQLNSQNGLYGDNGSPGGLLYSPPRDQFEGASVLLPVSIPEFPVTWRQVRLLVHFFLDERTPYLARHSISILNAGAKSGSARKLAAELTRFGLIVDQTENAGIEDIPSSIVDAQSADSTSGAFVAAITGMDVRPLPAGIDPAKLGQITIILGKDYVYHPLQDFASAKE
ncbi:LCP family protein [Candidatus Peregrinibacteria bacterium]|nr:LCP family protein [Candidatus Peregrinibacteria bacterium]